MNKLSANQTSTSCYQENNCRQLPVAYVLERERIIEVNAYLLAESDGFRRSPLDYWLAAENDFYG